MVIWLGEPFRDAWSGRDAFSEIAKLSQQATPKDIFRNKEGRRTIRFVWLGKSYFLKHHLGVGWKEILKNLFQLRMPVLGARNEYEAATALHNLGLDTLTTVAFGERGCSPATRESFLVTEDLVNTIPLDVFFRNHSVQALGFRAMSALIKKTALAAKTMHEHGINHRDFYLCHFLLEQDALHKIHQNRAFRCYLIDLHRCQQRRRVPRRWRVKDLGGLLYSCFDLGLSSRDCYRFMRLYTGKSLRETLHDPLWKETLRNAKALYQKDFGRPAPGLFE